jgi:glycine/D-amino acid oxidase-like deaminating enzyme
VSEPTSFDVAIVGGAALGAAIAYFLSRLLGRDARIALIERDPTFSRAATTLSAASIRQQFSTSENVRLSRFGWDFLSGARERFGPEGDPALREGGYLILASPGGVPALEACRETATREGAEIAWLDEGALARRFPWISVEGIAAGTLGLAREGWFDAHALLKGLRRAAREGGVAFLTGEVAGIGREGGRVTSVSLADGRMLACGALVNAAGPNAGRLAALAGRPLPVEPRKRTVFVIDAPSAPRGLPLIADPSGVWARPEGARFLAGWSPPESRDGPADPHDFDPDHALFEEEVWPALAARVPAFEVAKAVHAWAGHYDFNTLDQNAVVGRDPDIPNFIYTNGFSGHGLQHAPGVGRAVAELIAFGAYRSIDLSALSYERVAAGRPFREAAVI